MVRVATRKSTSRRQTTKRTVASRKRTPAKKTAAKTKSPKTAAKNKAPNAKILVPRIKTFMKHLDSFITKRKNKHGATDSVAKRLSPILTSLNNELKKVNPITESLAKSLKKVTPALKGVSNVPKSLRSEVQKLTTFLRDHVRNDVAKFANRLKKTLSPLETELNRLEKRLDKQVKQSKNKKIQLKVDPALKRRFNTLENNIAKMKTQWFKLLNGLNRYNIKKDQSAVNQLKKQFEALQKAAKKNLTILNRYSKAAKAKSGTKTQDLMTAAQVKPLEMKFDRIQKEMNDSKQQLNQFQDQLKAVKQF